MEIYFSRRITRIITSIVENVSHSCYQDSVQGSQDERDAQDGSRVQTPDAPLGSNNRAIDFGKTV